MTTLNQAVQKRASSYASESFEYAGSQLSEDIIYYSYDIVSDLIMFAIFIGFVFLACFFLFSIIQAILIAKSESRAEAGVQFTRNFQAVLSFIGKIFTSVGGSIKSFFMFFWLRKWLSIPIILIIVVPPLAQGFGLVDVIRVQTGQKAVDMKSGDVLDIGTHLYSPLLSTYIVSHVANYDFDIEKVTADSVEPQDVGLHINLVFHLDQDKLYEFYTREGTISIWGVANSIVTPRAVESIKKIISEYSYKEILPKQSEIKSRAIEEINDVLNPLNITLTDLNIVNIVIPRSYVKQIEEREILLEGFKTEKERLAAEESITKTALEIAQREKDIIIIEAEGIARANKIISGQRITSQMLELKKIENAKAAIEKWDGVVPGSVGGDWRLVE